MKKILLAVTILIALSGCSPVLNREYMKAGTREFDPSGLVHAPDAFKDKLFILGGVIIETKLTQEGSQIEALFVPVDRYGYLKDFRYQGRFLAVYPKAKGLLDPMIYKKGREITVAGTFREVRKGKIDEMEYAWPVFEIEQIYLWDNRDYRGAGYYYPAPYYYPYGYPGWNPWCYDAWGRPYACPPYWGPYPW